MARRPAKSPTDLVAGLFGARGSGKSHRVKDDIRRARPARLLIWDTMDEYGAQARAVDSLTAMLRAASAPRFALRYVPRGTDRELAARFGGFCALAFELGELVMVVEELQRVTSPSVAPAEWSDCTLRGRHKGLSIYGVSQRPASVDKNFFSNATMIRTGRLNFYDDVRCMARTLSVPLSWVAELRDREGIERNMLTGVVALAPELQARLQKKSGR